MATPHPPSLDDLVKRLDRLDERLQQAEHRVPHDDDRAEAATLRRRSAALRGRVREGRPHPAAAAGLEEDWNSLFASFERWIARLDERQHTFRL